MTGWLDKEFEHAHAEFAAWPDGLKRGIETKPLTNRQLELLGNDRAWARELLEWRTGKKPREKR